MAADPASAATHRLFGPRAPLSPPPRPPSLFFLCVCLADVSRTALTTVCKKCETKSKKGWVEDE